MSDHRSVQETEVAAAGKAGDLTEGMIRVLLQQRAEKNNQPTYNPDLFRTVYKRYLEKGVDKRTARDAAADIATGIGSKDSPAIIQAEAQVIANAQQQAQNYRIEAAKVTDPSTSAEEKQRAAAHMGAIEKDLGIDEKSYEVKAQTINGLAPTTRTQYQQRTPQPKETQSEHYQSEPKKSPQAARETFRRKTQAAFEEKGAKPETARLASHEIIEGGKGATDGPYTALAHQEIQHHQILKDMYQGVLEKHGVSSELASQAADQLANGNGANRSDIVRQAHNQALANIEYPQPTPREQSPKAINKATYSTEANHLQNSPSASLERQKGTSSAQQIWDEFHSGENGVFESMAKGNPRMQRLSDQLIAKEALLAGHSSKAIQAAIAQNSPLAQQANYPEAYARARVTAAEKSPEVEAKREQEKTSSQDTDAKKLTSRRDAQQDSKANQNNPPTNKRKPKKKVRTKAQELSL